MKEKYETCLAHNGALYAKGRLIAGCRIEVCSLPKTDALKCKYLRIFEGNKICQYETMTYDQTFSDVGGIERKLEGEDWTAT